MAALSTTLRRGATNPRRMRRIGDRSARRFRVLLALPRGASVDAAAGSSARTFKRFQGPGTRRAATRTLHPPATNPSSSDHVDGSDRPDGSQPTPPAGILALLHHYAGDAAAMASAPGGQAVDVCASCRSPGDSPRASRVGPSTRARESAVGGSTHRRRIEGPWYRGLSHDRAYVASQRRSRTRREARGDDLARVSADASAKPPGGRLLHRRDDLAPTAVRPLLHRAE